MIKKLIHTAPRVCWERQVVTCWERSREHWNIPVLSREEGAREECGTGRWSLVVTGFPPPPLVSPPKLLAPLPRQPWSRINNDTMKRKEKKETKNINSCIVSLAFATRICAALIQAEKKKAKRNARGSSWGGDCLLSSTQMSKRH